MTTVEDLLDKYACQGRDHHDTMDNYYSYYGLLSMFLTEYRSLIHDSEAVEVVGARPVPPVARHTFVASDRDPSQSYLVGWLENPDDETKDYWSCECASFKFSTEPPTFRSCKHIERLKAQR